MAISKDRHARIIIMRPEITLHSEAGYIFAGCSRRSRFFLQFGGGPYMLRQTIEWSRSLQPRTRWTYWTPVWFLIKGVYEVLNGRKREK